jgi:hypothetical protein
VRVPAFRVPGFDDLRHWLGLKAGYRSRVALRAQFF